MTRTPPSRLASSGPLPPGPVGRAVTVRSDGAGTRLVLLLSGCGVPSDLWQPVVDRLVPDTQVLRLDRPGMAGTPWPGALPALAAEVADLAAVLARYGRPAVVVAHSMAGPHAEALARLHPEQVAALVLVDGSVAWPPPRPSARRERCWRGLARLTRRLLQHRAGRVVAARAGWWGTTTQTRVRTRAVRRAVAATYADPEAVAATVAEQVAYPRQLADLDRLRAEHAWPAVPTVVLAASADGGAGWVGDQRRLADLLGGRLVVVEHAQHLMMLDCPDVVAAAVRAGTDETTVTEPR